jgi:prolyl-tRNA synthetase
MEVLDTPNTPTIDTLVTHLGDITAADTLKNVVLRTRESGSSEWQLLVLGVPGDREVDLKRVAGQLEPTEVDQAGPDDLATVPQLVKGYIGPQQLAEWKVRYLVDPLVVEGSPWVTGANEQGKHAAHVVRGRDFIPDGELGAVEIRAGDRCARCGGVLEIARGIEMGHVFALGRVYADKFGLQALDQDGRPVTITMGSYGVGVTRAVAAIAEQSYDEKGLCWPRSVAPADVHLVATGKDDSVFDAADALVAELESAGVQVMYDDRRGVSAGVKFKDAELIGVPTIVVVGKGLADGVVELRDRRTDERRDLPVADAAAEIARALT